MAILCHDCCQYWENQASNFTSRVLENLQYRNLSRLEIDQLLLVGWRCIFYGSHASSIDSFHMP